MNKRWIWFVAARYISKKRRNPLAVLGIATGVLALIAILSVMNGFQLGFIENILEVSSYHLRIEGFPAERTGDLQEIALGVPGVTAAVPFRDFWGLARGRRPGQQPVFVRGLPPDALEIDTAMAGRLVIESGVFDISGPRSAVLGAELARRMGLFVGNEVTLFSITGMLGGGGADEEAAGIETFTVTGLFRTGHYEYDSGWAFVNIESSHAFFYADDLILGVKIANRFHDRRVMHAAQRQIELDGGYGLYMEEMRFSSWRDYNRAFFNALRTEKLFMFILVGLIFIVVGLNIYQAQRRAVLERQEEIGLLRAVGGAEKSVRFVFVCDGAVVGLTGATIGLIFGLAISANIQQFFTGMEAALNAGIDFLNLAAMRLGLIDVWGGQAGGFAFFSPAVFYIREIPSRIIPHEVAVVYMFGFLSSLLAAWFASAKVSRIQPAEVLRSE